MLTFSVIDSLFEAVRDTEDGVPDHGLLYQVMCEDADGRRWVNNGGTFANGRRVVSEEGIAGWARDNGEAKARAEAFCQRIEKAMAGGRKLDPDSWTEIDPAYGSQAYQDLDRHGHFLAGEIMAAHDAGEISEAEALRLSSTYGAYRA